MAARPSVKSAKVVVPPKYRRMPLPRVAPAVASVLPPPFKPVIYLNGDGSYMDEAQILADLPKRVHDKETLAFVTRNFVEDATTPSLAQLKAAGIDASVVMRDSFGRWIRNAYGMWQTNNPHWKIPPSQAKIGDIPGPRRFRHTQAAPTVLTATEKAALADPNAPDNASDRIITAFVASLQPKKT